MKIVLLCLILSGCQSTSLKNISKLLIPVNASVSYFGSVGLHELGHAGTALGLGADKIKINMLPAKDNDGNFHLGLTTAWSEDWSESDKTLFITMGPTASFVSHVGFRELLKSNELPRALQPTAAWLGFGNQVAFYFHVISGLARIESTDLGKEEACISAVMLLGGITYDIYDLIKDGCKNFRVMFGEDFYENSRSQISIVSAPVNDGGYLGFRFEW